MMPTSRQNSTNTTSHKRCSQRCGRMGFLAGGITSTGPACGVAVSGPGASGTLLMKAPGRTLPSRWMLYPEAALQQLFVPVLEELLDFDHELVGHRAIDDAMVVADAEVHHGANGDRIVAVLVGEHYRLLDDSADAQDRNLRLVDDRHAELGAEDSRVGDGERATLHLVGLELFGTGALAKIGDGALQADETALLGVLDHGHDQSPVESDRDAEIDRGVVSNVVAFHQEIHDGPLAQAVHDGAREER